MFIQDEGQDELIFARVRYCMYLTLCFNYIILLHYTRSTPDYTYIILYIYMKCATKSIMIMYCSLDSRLS